VGAVTNLRSREQYAARAWDWGFLNDCFAPTRVRVSDLDGIVERNGCFLALEGKPAHVTVPRGQQITFNSLVTAGWTVLVLYGEPNQPVAMQHWPYPAKPAGEDAIQQFVTEWWQWANARPMFEDAA
jgi:hypothetical protein